MKNYTITVNGTVYDVTSDRRIPGSAQKISTKHM